MKTADINIHMQEGNEYVYVTHEDGEERGVHTFDFSFIRLSVCLHMEETVDPSSDASMNRVKF